jgi:translation elongation factor EF-4
MLRLMLLLRLLRVLHSHTIVQTLSALAMNVSYEVSPDKHIIAHSCCQQLARRIPRQLLDLQTQAHVTHSTQTRAHISAQQKRQHLQLAASSAISRSSMCS